MRLSLAEGYESSTAASRAAVLSMIFGAHALALVAALSLGGVAVVVKAVPLLVQVIPDLPARRPELPTRTIPLPALRAPEVALPTPPPIDNAFEVRLEEKPAPPPPAPATPAPVAVVAPVRATAPVIEPPRFDMAYLDNPAPAYPVFAKRAREQGTVLLRVNVDATGGVTGIDVEKSSGHQRLDDAALAAVKRWRFAPARSGERRVAGVALVPINFQLEG